MDENIKLMKIVNVLLYSVSFSFLADFFVLTMRRMTHESASTTADETKLFSLSLSLFNGMSGRKIYETIENNKKKNKKNEK